MTKNYGIKVTKVGKSIDDNDIRNIIMSSKYNMLKYHLDTTTSLEINNGDSSGSKSVAHNLGYVPAYIAYVTSTYLSSSNHFILPYPGGVYTATGYDIAVDSYADSSNITVRVNNSTDFGAYEDTANQLYDGFWGTAGFILNGHKDGNSRHGAFRFTNVTIPQGTTVSSANLMCYAQYRGAVTTSLKYKIWGIDEDDTASFGNPMGRAKTTATDTRQTSMSYSPPFYFGVDVHNEVNEILARGGWSSGNAMGFIIEDNNSDDGCWWEDDDEGSYLRIVRPGSESFYFRIIAFKDRIDF